MFPLKFIIAAVRVAAPAVQLAQCPYCTRSLQDGYEQHAAHQPWDEAQSNRARTGAGEQCSHALTNFDQCGVHHEMVGINQENESALLFRKQRHVGCEIRDHARVPDNSGLVQ